MARRRNRGPRPDSSGPAPAPSIQALSSPIVLDRSRAKIKHMRTLSVLRGITTEAELSQHLDALIELLNDLIVGGIEERPAGEFWHIVAEVKRQLQAPAKN